MGDGVALRKFGYIWIKNGAQKEATENCISDKIFDNFTQLISFEVTEGTSVRGVRLMCYS